MTAKGRSPRVVIDITEDHWNTAKVADSAACLIADAGRRAYPALTNWSVDAATIRASDKERGVRYTWLTPPTAYELLLAFDQGWSYPSQHRVVLNGAAKITQLRTPGPARQLRRRERLAELAAKEQAGTLTKAEQGALTQLRNTPERPTTHGTVETVTARNTIVGGAPLRRTPKGGPNPNMLASRIRRFGARTAQPSVVFREAVEAEVARRALAGPTSEAVGSDDAGPAEDVG